MKQNYRIYYQEKFVKFFFKFSIHTGNIKERLTDCAEDLEYAFMLSQTDGIPKKIQEQWLDIWLELTSKPVNFDYKTINFTVQNTVERKHFKSLQKYILFFLEEYDRVTGKE